jgi:hypothetical protein
MLASLGQEDAAFRFSQLALRQVRSKTSFPATSLMVGGFLSHLRLPAAHSLRPLLKGYRDGLETGDMMNGSICLALYAML